MQVTGLSSETFWRGETEIRGTVTDGGETYSVRILRKGSQAYDYSCSRMGSGGKRLGICSLSCTPAAGGMPMCVHAGAVLKAWMGKENTQSLKPVSTSQKVRFMVREYTNREVSRIIGAGEEGRVRLVPRLFFGRDRIKVQFFIGEEKMYAVKDLVTFAQAVEFERFVEYGKGLSFHHSIQAFAPECRPLVLFLSEMVSAYRDHYTQMKKGPWDTEPILKELILGRTGRERFFSFMEGQLLECEDYRKNKRMLLVKNENPVFEILAKREGRDGVRVSLSRDLMAAMGERRLFVADQEAIYCCDEEYTRALSVFMEYMVISSDSEYEVLINDRDMPLFCERVLKQLELLKLVKTEGVDLEDYRPQELKASFYFDSPGPEEITLKPLLSYGDFSFHPLDDENVPKDICRDVPGEFKVSQVITKFFKYTEDGTKNLVIRKDEESMYRLLSQGMQSFLELGEVFVSESFKKIRVLPPVNVAVKVKTNGSWLDIEVDAGGLSEEELSSVLYEYGRKKKFFRMRNGDFLTLGDGGLLTVSKLAKGLDMEKALSRSKNLRVPIFRSAFLDVLLKEDRSVTVYRDQLFKAMVRGMRNIEDSDYEVPAELEETLRGYQKVGFRWLKTLDSYGLGGILADEMGLGKTIQMIALLLDEKKRQEEGLMSLIVCPSSLVYNWENEIAMFAPSLKTAAVAGSQAEREEMLERLADSCSCEGNGDEAADGEAAERGVPGFENVDVLITSYDLLKRDLGYYQNMNFRFQIIDEAQYIKNSSTQAARAVKAISAKTRFALTGTPIENHLGELWSIFDFLMPGFLFTAQKFRKMFELPIVKEGDRSALDQLHRLTGPFILRRMKKDVLKELPDKLETVLYSAMEGEQKRLYTANAKRLKDRLMDSSEGDYGKEKLQILSELMKLRQICCEPSLCFDRYKGGSAKLETCMELLENGIGAGHKILLFSQFTSMLDIIAKRLDKEKIPYYMLTGSTSKKERMQLVSSFHRDQIMVFLISLKAGGTGLNLTAADVVIHYDPWWNVAAQNQATDRTHRIGQDKQVTVFKLITKHTIEENILKLQEMKKNLADTIVTEGAVSLSSLTKEDLMAMLDE